MEDLYSETAKGPNPAELVELTKSAAEVSPAEVPPDVAAEAAAETLKRLIYWESEETRPPFVLGASDIDGL